MEDLREGVINEGDTPLQILFPVFLEFWLPFAHKFLDFVQNCPKNLHKTFIRLHGKVTNPIHSISINLFKNMQQTTENGGLSRNKRPNEPI